MKSPSPYLTALKSPGNLITMLKVSAIYEQKVEEDMRNVNVMLEPVLLVIIWLGVVFIALAVILPIYNLVGSVN